MPVNFLQEPRPGYRETAAFMVAAFNERDQLRGEVREHREIAERRGTDPLLEIPNREVFHEILPGLIRRVLDPSDPYGTSITMLKIDAARLKMANEAVVVVAEDGEGGGQEIIIAAHEKRQAQERQVVFRGSEAEGDKYLKLMVEHTLEIMRPLDEIYRTGGDEVTIILPDTIDAASAASRYRKSLNEGIRTSEFPNALRLGVYVGSAVLVPDDKPLPTDHHELVDHIAERQRVLLAQVDASMLEDKKAVQERLEKEEGVTFDPRDDRKIIQSPE